MDRGVCVLRGRGGVRGLRRIRGGRNVRSGDEEEGRVRESLFRTSVLPLLRCRSSSPSLRGGHGRVRAEGAFRIPADDDRA